MSQMLLLNEETDAALNYSLEAQQIFEEIDFPDNRGYDISTLGMVIQAYIEKGELETASRYAEEGLVKYKDAKDQHCRAASLDYMSEVCQARSENEQASKYQQEAVEVVEALGNENRRMDDTRYQSKLYQKQAQLLAQDGDFDAAQLWSQKSIDLARATHDNREETDALLATSDREYQQGIPIYIYIYQYIY